MNNNRNKFKNTQNNHKKLATPNLRRNNPRNMAQYANQEELEQENIDSENMSDNLEQENVQKSNTVPQNNKPRGLPKMGLNSSKKNLGKMLNKIPGLNIFLKKYKLILLLVVAILAVFALVMLVALEMFDEDVSNESATKKGLAGYEYYGVENVCNTVTVYNHEKTVYTKQLDFEEEYIPGVVAAEVEIFSDAPEVLKLFAIAARSYALKNMNDDCSIEGSTYKQDFTYDENKLKEITADDHPIKQAVAETYGLVAIKGEKIQTTYYDAACYRGEDNSYYFIGYGSATLGSEKIQKIPKSWQNPGLLSYINKSKEEGKECHQGHGMGISQYGAYYLATQENYTMEDLIQYYIGNVELKTIYQAASGNYTDVTSSGTTDILTMSLKDFLSSKNTTPEAYNEYILDNIVSSGIGTRDAVVKAASTLVGGLYQIYGVRLPYTLSGQHYENIYNASGANINRSATSFYGVDPQWGSSIYNSSGGAFYYDSYKYTRYGPDCSGFVTWALHNAGFNVSVDVANSFGNYGTKTKLNGSKVAEPGDLLWNDGHIMLIIGVDSEKKQYFIAHASGGSDGVKINTISFSDSSKSAVDMTDWYASHKKDISKEEFIKKYRDGYVDGYTGNFNKIVAMN